MLEMLERSLMGILALLSEIGQTAGLLIFGVGFLGLFFKNTKVIRLGLIVYFVSLMVFVLTKGV